jgi:hypothetical protein
VRAPGGASALAPRTLRTLPAIALGAAAIAGCSGAGSEPFRTAASLPSGERRPDAIAVDLPTQPPAARSEVQAGDGVVTLRTPLGTEAARATIQAFFRAVVREDLTALGAVISSATVVQDLSAAAGGQSGPGRTREAVNFWGQRFRQHEYGLLASQVVYRDSEIETYRPSELGALPATLRQASSAALVGLGEDDLVLRVPIVTQNVKSERLFGSELCFWLRRSGDHYVIIHLAEPFPL